MHDDAFPNCAAQFRRPAELFEDVLLDGVTHRWKKMSSPNSDTPPPIMTMSGAMSVIIWAMAQPRCVVAIWRADFAN